jgi:hypothetical protein
LQLGARDRSRWRDEWKRRLEQRRVEQWRQFVGRLDRRKLVWRQQLERFDGNQLLQQQLEQFDGGQLLQYQLEQLDGGQLVRQQQLELGEQQRLDIERRQLERRLFGRNVFPGVRQLQCRNALLPRAHLRPSAGLPGRARRRLLRRRRPLHRRDDLLPLGGRRLHHRRRGLPVGGLQLCRSDEGGGLPESRLPVRPTS